MVHINVKPYVLGWPTSSSSSSSSLLLLLLLFSVHGPLCSQAKRFIDFCRDKKHDSQRHDRISCASLCPESEEFSPHFGVISLPIAQKAWSKKEIFWRKLQQIQWRNFPVIADFCRLSWSNISILIRGPSHQQKNESLFSCFLHHSLDDHGQIFHFSTPFTRIHSLNHGHLSLCFHETETVKTQAAKSLGVVQDSRFRCPF